MFMRAIGYKSPGCGPYPGLNRPSSSNPAHRSPEPARSAPVRVAPNRLIKGFRCIESPSGDTMNVAASSLVSHRRGLALPILVGGAIAGTLDHISAMLTFGPGVSRAIAAGLVGRWALQAGAGMWTLGLLLHFFI